MQMTNFRRALLIPIGASVLITISLFELTAAHAQQATAVMIKNFMFTPMSLTVKAGSTVTWKNLDGEPHTVVEATGAFRSNALDQNDSYAFKFDKPGVYQVFCGIHPYMKQTITVQ